MAELFLKFKDQNGEEKRVAVNGEKFVVGRHSEASLCIPDGRLSREHLKIGRLGENFVASDAGSSNGTKLNDEPLKEQKELKNGDVLDLGGVLVSIELDSDEFGEAPPEPEPEPEVEADVPQAGVPAAASAAPTVAASSSSTTMLLVIIPLVGLTVLIFAGLLIYFLTGTSKANGSNKDDFVYSTKDDDDDDKPANKKEPGNQTSGTTTGPSGTTTTSTTNNGTSDVPGTGTTGTTTTTTQPTGETGKIEQNGAAFLRKIAQNDPKAFLTTEQAQRLNSKIKQFSGSSALADNINSARKNSSQIKTLAQSKNLKPQFLAIAAISKLGTGRGDVVQTAQGLADVLDKLGNQLGNELADDSLLVIAAYSQGAAGDTMKMRNMLQELSNKFPESTRAIRTIWFLQKNGKITQAEFDNALNFLAIGTISQNPKDFGVNAEALSL